MVVLLTDVPMDRVRCQCLCLILKRMRYALLTQTSAALSDFVIPVVGLIRSVYNAVARVFRGLCTVPASEKRVGKCGRLLLGVRQNTHRFFPPPFFSQPVLQFGLAILHFRSSIHSTLSREEACKQIKHTLSHSGSLDLIEFLGPL